MLRQLELAGLPAVEEPPPWAERVRAARAEEAESADAASLLHRGRRAIEDFDYQTAERTLVLALAQSRGLDAAGLAAALALLELQVDLLGTDERTLELESQLPAAVREHPRVRTLLALAAARLGQVERARRLIAVGRLPVDSPRVPAAGNGFPATVLACRRPWNSSPVWPAAGGRGTSFTNQDSFLQKTTCPGTGAT